MDLDALPSMGDESYTANPFKNRDFFECLRQAMAHVDFQETAHSPEDKLRVFEHRDNGRKVLYFMIHTIR
jgi:hypothetical protein